PNAQHVVVQAPIENHASPVRDQVNGFVEGNGYVSIEAEHFTAAVNAPPVSWLRIPAFGRTVSGMTTSPADAPTQLPRAGSPRLEYRVFMFDTGAVSVKAYIAPS